MYINNWIQIERFNIAKELLIGASEDVIFSQKTVFFPTGIRHLICTVENMWNVAGSKFLSQNLEGSGASVND